MQRAAMVSNRPPARPQDVARWQATLAAVSEALEAVTSVQRAWVYLESIFGGSEDIRRQLPAEAALFEGVDAQFTRAMRELRATGGVVAATTRKGLLPAFQARARARARSPRLAARIGGCQRHVPAIDFVLARTGGCQCSTHSLPNPYRPPSTVHARRRWRRALSASKSPSTPTSSQSAPPSRASTSSPPTTCWRFWGRRATRPTCSRT